jgi:hypothetical protein
VRNVARGIDGEERPWGEARTNAAGEAAELETQDLSQLERRRDCEGPVPEMGLWGEKLDVHAIGCKIAESESGF